MAAHPTSHAKRTPVSLAAHHFLLVDQRPRVLRLEARLFLLQLVQRLQGLQVGDKTAHDKNRVTRKRGAGRGLWTPGLCRPAHLKFLLGRLKLSFHVDNFALVVRHRLDHGLLAL